MPSMFANVACTLIVAVLATLAGTSVGLLHASDRIFGAVAFPFVLPHYAEQSSPQPLPVFTSRSQFDTHCFGFVYATIDDPHLETEDSLTTRVTPLCQIADAIQCQRWIADLWSAVEGNGREEERAHTDDSPGSNLLEEWCQEVYSFSAIHSAAEAEAKTSQKVLVKVHAPQIVPHVAVATASSVTAKPQLVPNGFSDFASEMLSGKPVPDTDPTQNTKASTTVTSSLQGTAALAGPAPQQSPTPLAQEVVAAVAQTSVVPSGLSNFASSILSGGVFPVASPAQARPATTIPPREQEAAPGGPAARRLPTVAVKLPPLVSATPLRNADFHSATDVSAVAKTWLVPSGLSDFASNMLSAGVFQAAPAPKAKTMTPIPHKDRAVAASVPLAPSTPLVRGADSHEANGASAIGQTLPLPNALSKFASNVLSGGVLRVVAPTTKAGTTTAPPKEREARLAARGDFPLAAKPLLSSGSALREGKSPLSATLETASPLEGPQRAASVAGFMPSGLSDFASQLLSDEVLPAASKPKAPATTAVGPHVELRAMPAASPRLALKPAARTANPPLSTGFVPSGLSDFTSKLLTDEALEAMLPAVTTPASTAAATPLVPTTPAPTCVCLERDGRNICRCHTANKSRRYGSR